MIQTLRMKQSGATLLELMITLSIAAILMSIAVPSFQSFTRTNRIAAATNGLSSALQLARSEATTRGKRVSVCPSTNTETATPTCTAGASFASGWLIFVDDGVQFTVDGTDTRLRIGAPMQATVVIAPNTNMTNGVSYGALGSVAAQGYLNVTLDTENRCLDINRIGRVHVQSTLCTGT